MLQSHLVICVFKNPRRQPHIKFVRDLVDNVLNSRGALRHLYKHSDLSLVGVWLLGLKLMYEQGNDNYSVS